MHCHNASITSYSFILASLVLIMGAHTYCAGKNVAVVDSNTPQSANEQQRSSPVYIYHTVQKGETLTAISRHYGIPIHDITCHNSLTNPNNLHAGSRLKIPTTIKEQKPVYHTVKKGENLSRIAEHYAASTEDIIRDNNLKNPNRLFVGHRLKIIPGTATPSFKSSSQKKAHKAGLRFDWPVRPIRDVARDGHNGVASIGIIITSNGSSPVLCSERGTIKKIGHMRGYGNYVVVTHNSRYMTVYANLASIAVKNGQPIAKHSVIGTLEPKNAHLHFQINHAGKPQDALSLLPPR